MNQSYSDSKFKHYAIRKIFFSYKKYWALILFFIYCILLSMLLVSASSAQKIYQRDFGKQEYEARCASCHGKDGRGYGWLADFLIDGPTDLTLLSKYNGGVLPISRIYQSLWEGSLPIHGQSDMPAWGHIYQLDAYEMNVGDAYFSEIYAESRIMLLMEYISRLQAK